MALNKGLMTFVQNNRYLSTGYKPNLKANNIGLVKDLLIRSLL